MKEYFRKRIFSFRNASKGVFTGLRSEYNMKVQVVCGAVALLAGWWFHISETEWMMVVFSIGLVLVAELLNTAIEKLVDLVQPDFHPLAGKVKDMAAGGVFVAATIALVIGILVFGKHFIKLL